MSKRKKDGEDEKDEKGGCGEGIQQTSAKEAAVPTNTTTASASASDAKKKKKKTTQKKKKYTKESITTTSRASALASTVTAAAASIVDNEKSMHNDNKIKSRKLKQSDPEMKEALRQYLTCQMTANEALQSLTPQKQHQQRGNKEGEEGDATFKQPPSLQTFYGYANEIATNALVGGFESAKDVRKHLEGITSPQVKACKIAMISLEIKRYHNNNQDNNKKRKPKKTVAEWSSDYRKKHKTEISLRRKEQNSKKIAGLYVVNDDGTGKKKKKNLKVATVSKSIVCIRFI